MTGARMVPRAPRRRGGGRLRGATRCRLRPRTYLAAAMLAGFILLAGGEGVSAQGSETLDFHALTREADGTGQLPELQPFQARDGTRLAYRAYPAQAGKDLILLHGSAAHSAYLHPLAEAVRDAGVANVYVPDLRGHGPSPERRGDIDYIDQLQDDVADLMAHIRAQSDEQRPLVLGGHSSGGGLALRIAGSEYGDEPAAYLLLAPYLGHDAPTARDDSGWAEPGVGRIITLSVLNTLGVQWFNDTDVLWFNLPEAYRTGSETLAYSYRLMTGINPEDYAAELAAVDVPMLVLVGSEDEAFRAEAFAPTITAHAPGATVATLDGLSHLGLIASEAAAGRVVRWLEGL
ncbi:alpha/beta fold hydrolase [Aquisalimonas lutea]|uniref:alpha/beta hydrolase n=1 Tax=Aquisalimonas lutea TaxID=1327750 RepID=UPI0025B40538|nr:alpha/beta fold hydrolase [Aquisalimonas lutea]MDN3516277.1 alpha/beta fold hydrolase [Aquisalimonas lutea]